VIPVTWINLHRCQERWPVRCWQIDIHMHMLLAGRHRVL